MIQKNDLKIGNTVLFNFQQVRIDELLKDQIFFSWPGIPFGKMTYDFATPIPLTEEWLLKLGFVYTSFACEIALYDNVVLEVWQYKGVDTVSIIKRTDSEYDWDIEIFEGILFVHQLQNIYFNVSRGKELIIKEPVTA